MRYLLIAVGAVIVLGAVVAVCGILLPEKHTASRQARYRQTPDAVWAAITSYQGDSSLQYQVEASDKPHRYVTRATDPHHNFGGTWTWEIRPAEGGSTLRITEDAEIYNPMFRFVSRFIMGYTRSMDDALKAFATQFHENVQIED